MITSLIGAGFGTGWWFAGVSVVPGAAVPLRIVGVLVLAGFFAWTVWLRGLAGGLPAGERPPGAGPFGTVYGISVALMVVAIVGGAQVINRVIGKPEAGAAWVLFVVGVHFLPFVKLFGSKRFLVLAVLLTSVSVLAVVLGGVAGQQWAWLGVPGFGGAAVLWGTAAAALLTAPARIRAATSGW
ncbi:hypothetical protein ACFPM7_29765 [Actinokineospora guangxiensis]|uniref:TspO/MBR related protein n=1 Tax=Actinokineospora guangxiensis TaxID=1490288 RepID=A0ABW0EW05_9PSEU